jgi:hypothetical protein
MTTIRNHRLNQRNLEIFMKTNNKLIALAIIASAGLLSARISTAQPIDSVESLKNRAVAASPRAKEFFPWLTRSAGTATRATDSNLASVTKNRAFASSPRVLEEFPELLRPAQALREKDSSVASTVIKNRGFASTPRAREEFPSLARGNFTVTETPFQVAPLK